MGMIMVTMEQVHPTREQSIINLYEAALWMKAAMVSRRNVTSTANVLVDRCHFVGNERAMTLVGPFRSAAVYRSSFVANRAIHAGAGILVLVTKNTDVVVDNCTFVDNAAGQYRDYYAVGDSRGTVRFVGDEVHLNTACCNGVVMMCVLEVKVKTRVRTSVTIVFWRRVTMIRVFHRVSFQGRCDDGCF